MSLLVSIATVGGIVVAVSNYLNVAQTNALNNHISHFKIFQDYVTFEVGKRNMLNISSVDMFRWYNLIFHSSRTGSMDISGEYVMAMIGINDEISRSNGQAQNAKEGSYRYKEHQERISKKINFFGIKLGFHPRNDFDEIERQIFDLISTVNKAFCSGSIVPDIEKIHYRR
ncbi:hypothetical protein B6S09_16095 [Oceanimonas baumannii]|uniref:Uncharacterized protein n=1 Tax=Oceanimonas baumannii TaxID=129578 RepID=A0A235C9J2_9GAMM|nr:hypothetical protein B6S09_16095 [Oceanimonas baumannii]